MKKKLKIFKILILVITLFIGIICLINMLNKTEISESKILANTNLIEGHPNLINISECSEEFMKEYFEDYQNLKENYDSENMLLVGSFDRIEETFGAVEVVKAPNNQYYLQYATKEDKDNAFEKLNSLDEVIVEENKIYSMEEYDILEENKYNSWGIEATSLDYAIEMADGKILNDVTVAIIDSGVDLELFNKNFPGRIEETYNVSYPGEDMCDTTGHGTHIAGTIAEGTPSNVKLLPVKTSVDRYFSTADLLEAINYITYYKKADIINMSYGGGSKSELMYQTIEAAKENDIICVAAAGNDSSSESHYPSGYDNTIAISSIDSNLNLSNFSNYGSKIDFSAPGTEILSINGYMSGTSMATPHAVAAVAILKSYNKDLTLENVKELLKIHAIDLGSEGWDKYFGNGLISFEGAKFCADLECDGSNCDGYCVFKKNEMAVQKIEINTPILTSYNYGTIYNILATKVDVYYTDSLVETKALWELDNVEINGYDSNVIEEQVIEIKYNNCITTFSIIHPENYELGWGYSVLNETDVEITEYKEAELNIKKLYIPEKIDGYNVVSLAGNDLSTDPNQTPFIIKTRKALNDYLCFEEIYLPKTLIKIGRYGLANNYAIKKIVSEADSMILGEYAFSGNRLLREFDCKVISLEEGAFYKCSFLEKVNISENVTEIPDYTFSLCHSLKNIEIPVNLNKIGKYAFETTSIKELTISNNITQISEGAFKNCSELDTIIWSNNLVEIGDYAFYNTKISELILPNSINSIGDYAFSNTLLKTIHIPENVIQIGPGVFSFNTLDSITVDANNMYYDSRENCNAIIETETNTLIQGSINTVIPLDVTVIGKSAFQGNTDLIEFVIPENIIEIQDYAFLNCNNLKKVVIPRSVTVIGKDVFEKYYADNSGAVTQYLPITTLWLWTDSYAGTYAKKNKYIYESFDVYAIFITREKYDYYAFDTVNIEDIKEISCYYYSGYYNNTSYQPEGISIDRKDFITNIDAIKYSNENTSFRYGDYFYFIDVTTPYGQKIENEKVYINEVRRATPIYSVPENLSAFIGTSLIDIELPNGFDWMDNTIILNEIGHITYKAKYTPEDTTNYNIVENIEININVLPIECTSIYVPQDTYTIESNKPISELGIYALPENATNKELTYEIEDTNVAQIQNDTIIRVNNGTTNLIVTTTDGTNISVKIPIIIEGVFVNITELTVDINNINFTSLSQNYQIIATIKPTDATNQILNYKSNDTSVATVDSEGNITPIANGTTQIIITTTDGSNLTAIINVTVDIKCTSICAPQETYTFSADTTISELGIYALPDCATNKELTYEIEDTSIAKIENDTIVLLKYGTTNLIVKTTDGSNIIKEIPITVNLPLPFIDIKETDWCYGAVSFVYKNGYIVGTTETTYEPGKKLTRGMIVTILNRMEGNNKPDVECKFSDVQKGEYYYNSVKWATEAGIVHGYEDGKFRPNKAITREELAVILRNYTRYKGVDTNLTADLSGFNDGNTVSSFAQKSVEWAVARGVITGYTHNNTIAPQGTATRDVAASVIYKYFKTAN